MLPHRPKSLKTHHDTGHEKEKPSVVNPKKRLLQLYSPKGPTERPKLVNAG